MNDNHLRLKRLRISTTLMLDLFKKGEVTDVLSRIRCVDGIPEDSVLVSATCTGDAVEFTIQSPSFDPVDHGLLIPVLPVMYHSWSRVAKLPADNGDMQTVEARYCTDADFGDVE